MRYELKPLGVGGTLDQAIRIFKDRFALFLVILLILRIPGTAIIQYYVFTNMGQLPAQPTDAQVNEFFSRLGRLYVYVLAPSILADMLLITPFTSAALIHAAARVYLDEPVNVWQALRVALRRYVPFVWTSVLFSLIILTGTFFCVLPGILLFFQFALAMTLTVLEPVSGFAALGRSRQLMRSVGFDARGEAASGSGNYLNLFLLLLALFFIQGGIGATANFIPEVHLQVLANAIFGSIALGFATVAQVVFYYSCRCRHDGFDLLHLARIVAQTPIEEPVLEARG
jgi:hypothetical protein